MAVWYVSSVDWAAASVWLATHSYIVGDLVRPVSPAATAQYMFRVSAITTGISAGSEPTWPVANNATVVNGGCTFTNVTGQSAYGWTAACGNIDTMYRSTSFLAAGDIVYFAHTNAHASLTTGLGCPNQAGGNIRNVSVNRAGSVPPVAADVLAGASVTSGGMSFINRCPWYWQGFTFTQTSSFGLSNTNSRSMVFEDCYLDLSAIGTGTVMSAATPGAKATFINTPMKFGSTAHSISIGITTTYLQWFDTPSAIQGTTLPNSLFSGASQAGQILCRGVDFSALGSGKTLVLFTTGQGGTRVLFDSCKINSAVTRASTTASSATDIVDLINCDDGSGTPVNERYQVSGTLTTERTIYLTGGAADDTGHFSHKIVTTTSIGSWANRFCGFTMLVNNAVTGVSQTATVEIISSGTLTNEDISLELHYLGTSSSYVSSVIDTRPATVITTAANLTTSSATWASSPATPVKQYLQVTFTALTVGVVQGIVSVGKASATVYYNPAMTIV